MRQLLDLAGVELRYHLRRPVTYLYMAAMFAMGFTFTATSALGAPGGAININSPQRIGVAVAVLTMISTILTSAIAGAAILRDFELRAHELLFATRLRKPAFVFGRYLGAALVTSVVLACGSLGLWTGAHMPWVDPTKLGPEVAGTYLLPTLIFVLPNALFISALFFAVGVLTRSFLAVYVQGIVLFVGWHIGVTTLNASGWQRDIDGEFRVAMLDPFGIFARGVVTRYWSVEEQNTQVVGLVGPLLYNRLLWLGIGALVLLVAYRRFRMETFPGARKRAEAAGPAAIDEPRVARPLPPVTPRFGRAAALAAFVEMTRLYFRDLVGARAFKALVAIGAVDMVFAASTSQEIWGNDIYPVTWAVVQVIHNFNLYFIILIVMYSGELVWRERGLLCDQIHDAAPVSSVTTLAAKISALLLVVAVLLAALLGFGVLFQTYQGYTRYELDVYVLSLFGAYLPRLALYVLLGFSVHLLVNNKVVGIVLIIVYQVVDMMLPGWGVEHRLVRLADMPELKHSSMDGFGPNVAMYAWLFAYYLAFAAVLLTLSRLLLVRGAPDGLRSRLRLARSRVTRGWLACFGVALVAWFGLGGWAYHNMHVLNAYLDREGKDDAYAAYERRFKRYEGLLQPRITAARVHVDLDPERAGARAVGTYHLVNPHAEAIDTILVQTDASYVLHALEFAGGAALAEETPDDPLLRVQVWRLAAPLAPGGETTLRFDVEVAPRGFAQLGGSIHFVENGTFFNNFELFPAIGYRRGAELADPDKRARRGLPPRQRMRSIDDAAGRRDNGFGESAGWIDLSTSVCTAPDQIAVAPGRLAREWSEDGRRCFAYAMDAKTLNWYAFVSGRYSVLRDRHAGVDIEIYYHPEHDYNLESMVRAIKAALDYHQSRFSPYPHSVFRVLEYPRYQDFAQAFANTIPYSEGIGFVLRVRSGRAEDYDMPFAITAHEVAHQWWGHQVAAADVQGATMLIESLSDYTAMIVVEREYGIEAVKKILRNELATYLRGRANERDREMPLARNEEQKYIHYAKGTLVLYLLKDLLGEEVMSAALARLVREHAYQGSPYPSADDLVKILRELAPPEYQELITDLFERITLYDNKVSEASVSEEGGEFRVRFKVSGRKLHADGRGKETTAPLADPVDIGVFAAPGPSEYRLGKPLYFERRTLRSPSPDAPTVEEFVEVVVDERPSWVGVDPYNKLIDRDPDDNLASL